VGEFVFAVDGRDVGFIVEMTVGLGLGFCDGLRVGI
jgi:hypothetical protein